MQLYSLEYRILRGGSDRSKPTILSCPFTLDFIMERFLKWPIVVCIDLLEGPRGSVSSANFVSPSSASRLVCVTVGFPLLPAKFFAD